MAYFLLPRKVRNQIEGKLAVSHPKVYSFIQRAEKFNRFPNQLAKGIYSSLPNWRPSAKPKWLQGTSKLPGNPVARRTRAQKQVAAGKRKQPPQSNSAPKRKKPRKMPTRRSSKSLQLMGQGHYHGRFKAPTKRVRAQKYPVVQKLEESGSSTDAKCVYVMHTTHPLKYVLRGITMAMLHKFFQQQGVQIRGWTEKLGQAKGIATTRKYSLRCGIVYQQNPDAASDPEFTEIANAANLNDPTYLDFAISMADGLALIYDNVIGNKDIFVTQIQWETSGIANVNLCYKQWDASEIRVAVSGKSMINVQNRTAAGDVADNTQTTSIYANPLHGKHYAFTGNNVRIKHLGVGAVNTSAQLVPGTDSGVVQNGSQSTNISSQAQDILAQPPAGNYFYNCTSTSYIRLEPGAIKQSTCAKVVTKTLNQWLRSLQPWLESASDLNSLNTFQSTSLGVSRVFALEKVADIGSGNPVLVGYERDGILCSKMFFKKRRYTAATNDASLIAPPAV